MRRLEHSSLRDVDMPRSGSVITSALRQFRLLLKLTAIFRQNTPKAFHSTAWGQRSATPGKEFASHRTLKAFHRR
jgi:hypothetical protein